ncbi:MAG: S8 family serine peptidase, partial [Nocardioides sp.]|nr:S8 family serine peptidase [Nocardioides sp.]
MGKMMRRRLPGSALAGAALLLALTQVAVAAPAGADSRDDGDVSGNPLGERLYLVTMSTPGTAGYAGPDSKAQYRTKLLRDQADTLARVGDVEPTYRWTSALSGFAAELDSTQAATVASSPDVELVEAEGTLQLAGSSATSAAPRGGAGAAPRGGSGRGTVIGFVDSGINPDNPVFAATPTLGGASDSFRGTCDRGEDWSGQDCNDKVVGARYFIKGFGADRLGSEARVSPRDDDGHGTQVASIAAGNADVTALADGDSLGDFSGTASDARIAANKACWSAPDPGDD